jgi:hypothetical protein
MSKRVLETKVRSKIAKKPRVDKSIDLTKEEDEDFTVDKPLASKTNVNIAATNANIAAKKVTKEADREEKKPNGEGMT